MKLRTLWFGAVLFLGGCLGDPSAHEWRLFYTVAAADVSAEGVPKRRLVFESSETVAFVARGPGFALKNVSMEIISRKTGRVVFQGGRGSFDSGRGAIFWHTRMKPGRYRAHCYIDTTDVETWDFDVEGAQGGKQVRAGGVTLTVPGNLLPVMFYTAHRYATEAEKQKALAAGVNGFAPGEPVFVVVTPEVDLKEVRITIRLETGAVALKIDPFSVAAGETWSKAVRGLPPGKYAAQLFVRGFDLAVFKFTVTE